MPRSETPVESRIAKLERNNRLLVLLCLGFPCLAFLLGADVADKLWQGKTVTAEKFVLVDADGKTRAVLANQKDGPHFILFHETDNAAIHLAANGDKEPGPAIWLAHEEGRTQVAIRGLKTSGPALHLYGDEPAKQGIYLDQNQVDGVPVISIRDENEEVWSSGGKR